MQNYFYELADYLQSRIQGSEQFTCYFSAEVSDFVRFNRGAIRQPGYVRQIYLSLDLINGLRHVRQTFSLNGDFAADRQRLDRLVRDLRAILPELPDDPHWQIATDRISTEHIIPSKLPDTRRIVEDVLALAHAYDFVGILACGPIYRGFANFYGQRNWHETSSFNLDWSLYLNSDKAVKTVYAGFDWNSAEFSDKFQQAAAQLELLKRKPVTLKVGRYRAYLTPSALSEMIGMLNWGGFSEKSLQTKHSPLCKMRDEGLLLHPSLTLCENIAEGVAPGFQGMGYIKPERINLIEQGRLVGSLVSPRTAKEYGITTNGADQSEAMTSIDVAPGVIPTSEVLATLGTGILIGNLWYLNFSDRTHGRITGMTRFASFWVEDGEIKAPLNVMRFDDSLFRLLGSHLLGLTQEREFLLDSESYGQRGTQSARLPGALVQAMAFVL